MTKKLFCFLKFFFISFIKTNNNIIEIFYFTNFSSHKVLKHLLKSFIEKIEPDCIEWFKTHVHFPLSMVDGIVPNNNKTSDFFDLSYKDNALVVTEPYREWYIQSKDTQLKKILDNDNINYVDDVKFYENIKLKILNASHSAIAYIGHLLGYVYVHEAINDDICYNFISNFLDKEVIPTLPQKNGFDLELTSRISDAIPVPVIASGGVGNLQHLVDGVKKGGADAVLAASIFHFGEHSIQEAKDFLAQQGVLIRQ